MLTRSLSDLSVTGGVLSTSDYIWFASGPHIEIIHTRTGNLVSSWTFGSIFKDTSTKIVCVEEIKCVGYKLPLLAIGLECTIKGMVCIFDIIRSKVLRVIELENKVGFRNVTFELAIKGHP